MKTANPTRTRTPRPPRLSQARPLGRTEVLPTAVAAVAGHAASSCYGIMGMAGRGLRDGVAELLRRESAHRGVEVRDSQDGLVIDLYVIVQYGTRINEVAHNLQSAIRFEVERWLSMPVTEVNVFVQGVHDDHGAG
ncbi:MAG TPA: Asp23/Gls24 family envelope stress response protein [Candidatus Dormibacteraeota bacterium]|nr:Asp23/Gls24 family envelope stress response protein [Candidatus Dormibacteraeota bacterium]